MNNPEISDIVLLIGRSFFITIIAIMLIRPIAFKIGLTDRPCSRKRHKGEIPLIGGLAIYLCITYNIWIESVYSSINIAFFTAVTVIVVTGLIDDFKNLNFKTRLVTEIFAALIMVYGGEVQITNLGDLLGFGDIELGVFSTLFTVFAIVGGINAFNMIDGIDGLAGSTALIIFFLLSSLCIILNCGTYSLQFAFILASATAAFLLFNFPIPGRKRALVFLGDTGSMLLGFTICWLVIAVTQGENKIISPVTILWIIGAPLLDTTSIIIRRMRKGRSPFAPDREHFHHILPVAGYGKYATIFIILLFSVLLAAIGLAGDLLFNAPDWLMFYLFIGLFAIYNWSMSHSWKMVKLARYLRIRKKDRRRKIDRRRISQSPLPFADRRERRSGTDRRHQARGGDLEAFQKQDREANPVGKEDQVLKTDDE